jgi:hypothetical protein
MCEQRLADMEGRVASYERTRGLHPDPADWPFRRHVRSAAATKPTAPAMAGSLASAMITA